MTTKRTSYRLKRMEYHKRTTFEPIEGPPKSTIRTPIIRIENHQSEVLSCDFHSSGKYLLSSNRNGEILVSDIYGTFTKLMLLQGHGGAVMQAEFSRDGFNIYSCYADGTLSIWDTFKGYRLGRLQGHTASVNSVNGTRTGYPLLCSGANDGTVRLWDVREKQCTMILQSCAKVTSTCFSAKAEFVYSADIDCEIKIWDLKTREIVCTLNGHTGKVTGIALSPCGSFLLSSSVDNTLRVWDVRPDTTSNRCIAIFPSYQNAGETLLRCAWSPSGTKIAAGTSERDLIIRDTMTGEVVHSLSGHENTITDVAFHPKEAVILSSSNDHFLFLHEI